MTFFFFFFFASLCGYEPYGTFILLALLIVSSIVPSDLRMINHLSVTKPKVTKFFLVVPLLLYLYK